MMQIVSSDTANCLGSVESRVGEDEDFDFLLAKRKHERDTFLGKIRQRKEIFTLRFSGFLASVVMPYMEDFRLSHTGLLVEDVPSGLAAENLTLVYAIGEKSSGLSFVLEIQCNAESEEILCGSSFFNIQETTFYTGFEIKSLQLSNDTIFKIERILMENLERLKKKISLDNVSVDII